MKDDSWKKELDDKNKDTVKIGVKVNDEIPTTGLSPVGTLRFTKGNFSGNEVDIRSQQEIMIGRSSQYRISAGNTAPLNMSIREVQVLIM